jgi:hypothetical protein
MSSLREKGFCPRCGMYVAIRKDGKCWGHEWFKGAAPAPCPGSGLPPKVMK